MCHLSAGQNALIRGCVVIVGREPCSLPLTESRREQSQEDRLVYMVVNPLCGNSFACCKFNNQDGL